MSEQKRLYTETHEWFLIEDGTASVGITDFAQKELTDIVFVELPEVGRRVEKGEAVAVIESVKTASDIYSPVKGEICEVNMALSEKPELINEDPFGKGWLFKVKIEGKVNSEDFLDDSSYNAMLQNGEPQ